MSLKVLGINHKSAPIAVREKLTFNPESANEIIQELISSELINEIVLISTCNRTELYLEACSTRPVLHWLRKNFQLGIGDIKEHSYFLADKAVVKHLMRVASGLDSMVLGEAQILGQIKHAYHNSIVTGCLGKCLGRLFQNVFSTAKSVRTRTDIGVNSLSVAYIAVCLAEQIFADIKTSTAMLIGAGDTAKLILKHLCSAGVSKILIANRTIAKAQELAVDVLGQCQVECIELEMLPNRMFWADIVITSTASPLPIIGKGLMERTIKLRKRKPVFMVDIAVPRDIEPEVGQLQDVYLYCIDDLQGIAVENRQTRLGAVEQAEIIIDRETENFMGWLRAQDSISTIRAFRDSCELQKEKSLQEAIVQLKSGKDPLEVIHRLATVMNNRLMHRPTSAIRKAGFNGNNMLLDLIRQLYKLN